MSAPSESVRRSLFSARAQTQASSDLEGQPSRSLSVPRECVVAIEKCKQQGLYEAVSQIMKKKKEAEKKRGSESWRFSMPERNAKTEVNSSRDESFRLRG